MIRSFCSFGHICWNTEIWINDLWLYSLSFFTSSLDLLAIWSPYPTVSLLYDLLTLGLLCHMTSLPYDLFVLWPPYPMVSLPFDLFNLWPPCPMISLSYDLLAIWPSLIFFIFCRLLGKEKRIGGFDLIWDDGPVFADEGGFESSTSLTPLNSFLGN